MEQTWDLITNVTLVAALAIFAVFVCLGLYQWIKRKSLKKVDQELLWTLLPLTLMVAVYFIFDKIFVWNTRPNGSGEPSFPSSHVMVVATILFLVMILLPKYIKSKATCAIFDILMFVLIILVAVGRVLASMHWVSDVIGGLIFAAIFAVIYYFIIKKLTKGVKHA